MNLGYRFRVKCLYCPGSGTNWLMCSHEVKGVELLKNSVKDQHIAGDSSGEYDKTPDSVRTAKF